MNIPNKSRHVRWNFETSPDGFFGDSRMVRYHFVVVDDRDREGTMGKLFEQLASFGPGVDVVRTEEGKVAGTRLRYLFQSVDSPVAPNLLQWREIRRLVKRDIDLRERLRGKVEDYVSRIYE